jgi:hypothetical protein
MTAWVLVVLVVLVGLADSVELVVEMGLELEQADLAEFLRDAYNMTPLRYQRCDR